MNGMNAPRTEDPKVKRPAVDEKSFELAEHFLSGLEGDEASEDQKWQLAEVIQTAVEDWFVDGRPPEPYKPSCSKGAFCGQRDGHEGDCDDVPY